MLCKYTTSLSFTTFSGGEASRGPGGFFLYSSAASLRGSWHLHWLTLLMVLNLAWTSWYMEILVFFFRLSYIYLSCLIGFQTIKILVFLPSHSFQCFKHHRSRILKGWHWRFSVAQKSFGFKGNSGGIFLIRRMGNIPVFVFSAPPKKVGRKIGAIVPRNGADFCCELTCPPPSHVSRWCSSSPGGIC